jgi:hypothetical protein
MFSRPFGTKFVNPVLRHALRSLSVFGPKSPPGKYFAPDTPWHELKPTLLYILYGPTKSRALIQSPPLSFEMRIYPALK